MNFSFFYTRGGSGYIRGHQMATRLGGKMNPQEGYEDDLCICVKISPPHIYWPKKQPKRVICDVDDSFHQARWLKEHPECGVIAICETARDYLKEHLNRDDIYYIPHQHCNFERRVRPEREVKVVGIIGSRSSFQYPAEEFKKEVEKLGMELRYEEDYWNTYKSNRNQEMRLNVADFYYNMDVQVVYRPTAYYQRLAPFANPNKMGNSSSFGIPTVAYPEKSYVREFDGCFLPANTIPEMIEWIRQLRDDPHLYNDLAKKNLDRSEFYHIDSVEKMYRALK